MTGGNGMGRFREPPLYAACMKPFKIGNLEYTGEREEQSHRGSDTRTSQTYSGWGYDCYSH